MAKIKGVSSARAHGIVAVHALHSKPLLLVHSNSLLSLVAHAHLIDRWRLHLDFEQGQMRNRGQRAELCLHHHYTRHLLGTSILFD